MIKAMKPACAVPHFDKVNKADIKAQFFADRKHRASLYLPFTHRKAEEHVLCVIGQNPSEADENCADKTIRYVEELIYRTRSEYSALMILNLDS